MVVLIQMFNRISSIILAVLLFLLLLGSAANFYVVFVSVGILVLATLIINYKRLGLSIPHLLLPCFYLIGAAGVFTILPTSTMRLLFLIMVSVLFYLLENDLGKESHLLQNLYLLSVFALFVTVSAFQFYFHLGNGLSAVLVFALTYILIIQGFAGFSLPAKRYFEGLIALTLGELAWGLSLWPTHFLVNGVLLFCAYYLLWMFAFSAFFGRLNPKKIYWQLTLVGIVVALTLLTATWRPLT